MSRLDRGLMPPQKSVIVSMRLGEGRLAAFDAVASRLGTSRNDLLTRLVDLAIQRDATSGWACRTVRLSGRVIETTGDVDPTGDAGYITEMALPDAAWEWLEAQPLPSEPP